LNPDIIGLSAKINPFFKALVIVCWVERWQDESDALDERHSLDCHLSQFHCEGLGLQYLLVSAQANGTSFSMSYGLERNF